MPATKELQRVEAVKEKPSGNGEIYKILNTYTKEFLTKFDTVKQKNDQQLGAAFKELAKAIRDQPLEIIQAQSSQAGNKKHRT